MSSLNIFDIAGSGMNAQNVRLNLVASNISNANTVSSSEGDTYKSRQPVFAAEFKKIISSKGGASGVKVLGVVESKEPTVAQYMPNHPMADEKGYIYKPNVNVVEEMANMMSASRSYQNNVEVLNTAKQMMLQTLKMGQ